MIQGAEPSSYLPPCALVLHEALVGDGDLELARGCPLDILSPPAAPHVPTPSD